MEESSKSPYQYVPLPPGALRLVELLPGQSHEIIRIDLQNYDGKHHPEYDAVSYTWGSPELQRTIYCKEYTLKITENLFNLLLSLRKRVPRSLLWVDAISINQGDLQERASVVSTMPEIYKQARRTICWVGSDVLTPVRRLISGLRNFHRGVASGHSLVTDPDVYHSEYRISSAILDRFQSESRFSDAKAWKGLDVYLSLEYFQRNLSWDDLCSALEICIFCSANKLTTSPGLLNIVTSQYLRRRRLSNQGQMVDFKDYVLARQACKLKAVSPPAYLFSIYWIMGTSASELSLHPNYPLPIAEVFSEAAKALGLYSLSLVDSARPQVRDLPSWVPDWVACRNWFLLDHPKSHFCASPRPLSQPKFESDVNSGRSLLLSCSGVQVDTLKTLSEYLPPRRHCDHYNLEGANLIVFDEWFEFAKTQIKKVPWSRGISEMEFLVRFADTIQARGCNSIWEPSNLPLDVDQLARNTLDFTNFLVDEDAETTTEARLFHAACFPSHHKRFGITERGLFCIVPMRAKTGDLVCIPEGNRVPLIFSKTAETYGFTNLGECYVNGLMMGEAAGLDDCKEAIWNVR